MTVKKKMRFKLDFLATLIMIVGSIYLIYSILLLGPIEKLIRYIIVGIIILLDIYILKRIRTKKRKSNWANSLIILISIIFIFIGYNIAKLYGIVDSINKDYINYSSSLVVLSNSEIDDLQDIKDMKIGIIKDSSSIEGHSLPLKIVQNKELINNNEIVQVEAYDILIADLYDKNIDAIFLPANYEEIYANLEEYKELDEDVKAIYTESEKLKKANTSTLSSSKKITEPFTILLIGIDSTTKGIANADSFNGDSLMLITFNPSTLNATILSIPRDSYVPIACFTNQVENKITHAAARGTSCVINTIQNFTGIKIDYYMKINFTGVVDLVNALGGVEVNVPYSFCEQDSQRKFGKNTIYVKKGFQTLDGEEALAFSRNRKLNYKKCTIGTGWYEGTRSDFVRGKNQQAVVQAMVDKIKKVDNVDTIYDLLDTVSDNMDTNMTTSVMLSFYDVIKDILLRSRNDEELFTIQRLELVGYGQTIYDERTRLNLWNYVLNTRSIDDVVKAMKVNLELEENTPIKEFDFSINKNYSTSVIGTGPYTIYTSYYLVPNLTTYTRDTALKWANSVGLTIEFKEVKSTSYSNGKIISQNYPVNKRVDLITDKTITLEIVNNYTDTSSNKTDCTLDSNINSSICTLPDLTGKSISDLETWANGFSNNISVKYEYIYDLNNVDKIISFTPLKGTTVNAIINSNTTILIKIGTNKAT